MEHLQEAAWHMVSSVVIMPLGVTSLFITVIHLNSDPSDPHTLRGFDKKNTLLYMSHMSFVCLAAGFTLRAFLGSFSERITRSNTKRFCHFIPSLCIVSFHPISVHRLPVISNDYAAC